MVIDGTYNMSVHLTTTELQAPAFASRLPLLDGSGPPLRQSWACRRYQTKNVSPNRTQKYGYTFKYVHIYGHTSKYKKYKYKYVYISFFYHSCWLCWLHLLIETVLSFCSAPCKTTGVFWHMTRYTYIHVHAYIYYIYRHALYIYLYTLYLYTYIVVSIYQSMSVWMYILAISLLFRVCFFPVFIAKQLFPHRPFRFFYLNLRLTMCLRCSMSGQ